MKKQRIVYCLLIAVFSVLIVSCEKGDKRTTQVEQHKHLKV